MNTLMESSTTKTRAGIVPFLADGRALFMVSSNPAFGGSDPAIAKGRVDSGESVKRAAIREGGEELGLRSANMIAEPFIGWTGTISGLKSTYPMEVYLVQVANENNFSDPDLETEYTVWMTRSQFKQYGRKSHHSIADALFEQIEAYVGRNK